MFIFGFVCFYHSFLFAQFPCWEKESLNKTRIHYPHKKWPDHDFPRIALCSSYANPLTLALRTPFLRCKTPRLCRLSETDQSSFPGFSTPCLLEWHYGAKGQTWSVGIPKQRLFPRTLVRNLAHGTQEKHASGHWPPAASQPWTRRKENGPTRLPNYFHFSGIFLSFNISHH